MPKQYGYEIREKKTGFLAGDNGEEYYSTRENAMDDAKKYLKIFLIPDEYEGKVLEDFEITTQEII
ncbi:hypothetical protein [Roseburia faecis]|uniref:hypothetical protein n=1 Tax=Roseburia faecis TaxID=301302 RepID=UPI0031B61663